MQSNKLNYITMKTIQCYAFFPEFRPDLAEEAIESALRDAVKLIVKDGLYAITWAGELGGTVRLMLSIKISEPTCNPKETLKTILK